MTYKRETIFREMGLDRIKKEARWVCALYDIASERSSVRLCAMANCFLDRESSVSNVKLVLRGRTYRYPVLDPEAQ